MPRRPNSVTERNGGHIRGLMCGTGTQLATPSCIRAWCALRKSEVLNSGGDPLTNKRLFLLGPDLPKYPVTLPVINETQRYAT